MDAADLSRDAFSKNMWGRSRDIKCWVCRTIYVLPRRTKRRIYGAEDSDDDVDCYDYSDLNDDSDMDRYGYNYSFEGYSGGISSSISHVLTCKRSFVVSKLIVATCGC